jgi:hypothetical protein
VYRIYELGDYNKILCHTLIEKYRKGNEYAYVTLIEKYRKGNEYAYRIYELDTGKILCHTDRKYWKVNEY